MVQTRLVTALFFERFFAHVEKLPCTCWRWRGAIGKNGYGYVRAWGRTTLAHRVAWEMYKNLIPTEKEIDHLCRNRWCVNPAHMEVVTNRINQRRGAKAKLTPAQVREIRARFIPGLVTQTALAKEYGVHPAHVCRIVNHKMWPKPKDLW